MSEGLQGEVEIVNDLGLHARAATRLVQVASKFQSNVEVVMDGMKANAKSIMGLLALGARKGVKLTLLTKGEDQDKAFQAIKTLIDSGFEEEKDNLAKKS